ncbi:MFS transporter [Lactonifactor longoviformis]|uniref:Sugar phosphate permease n=1 Tax=Lactonifactor longoviformis DSM 17459 TaxID=1122155 RepID=A0A1M5B4R0_9CLOT|nr:MFS transporter [Lactonifactor longoviformis]POP32550.1 MFS transporter [Lactonifactor longoviformis]SHF37494.1 Sugar phosphate permease [Lactonifactor longoviformis DSM 17459]
MNKAFIKKYGTLLLLACAPGFIFQLPYIRESFYVPIQNAMQLTNAQMGSLSAWYAVVATPAYFLGGIVADKFSPRIMLTFSLISTGLLGIWFSMFPGYSVSRIIFALMGFTTVMTFWSSVIKAVRMLGTSDEQGRLFGLHEGMRGFLNAALVFMMAAVYARFSNNIMGATWAIRFCAALLLILGVLCWIFIDDKNTREQTESLKEVCIGMAKCLKIPRVWMLVGIVFTAYSVYALMSYINAYLVTMCGMSETASATLGGVRYLMQGVGGVAGGFLADKLHSRLKVISGAGLLLAISWGIFIIIPAGTATYIPVLCNFLIGVILVYTIRSQYFADIDDAGIDVNVTGRVSGILSTFGYLPDVFLLTLTGSWIDSYPGQAGYNRVFVYAAVMGILCMLISAALFTIVKKDKKSQKA